MNFRDTISRSVTMLLARVIPFSWLLRFLPKNFIICGHLIYGPNHFVHNHYRYPSLEEFDRYIKLLRSMGYVFVSFDDYLKEDDRKKVLLTFDDGFRVIYGELRQYLREQKIPYMIFVIANALKDPTFQIKTILPTASSPAIGRTFLNEEEILVLKSEGVHVGFHTRDHDKVLPKDVNDPSKLEELSIPKEYSHLFSEPLAFAYPYFAPSNYKEFNNYMMKESGFKYFFDLKGLRPNEGNHFYRAAIDAPLSVKDTDITMYALKLHLVGTLIRRFKEGSARS